MSGPDIESVRATGSVGRPQAEIVVDGRSIQLLPERAIHHVSSRTLYIADMHIGKSAAFRSAGVPVPDGDTADDLNRLGRAIEQTGARRLCVLGDFLHASSGLLDQHWRPWRTDRPNLDVIVVRGNHDLDAGDPPPSWGLRLVDEPWDDGVFSLRHHPDDDAELLSLCGHIHPAVRVKGAGRDRARLPAFIVGPRQIMLPAFTAFAGGYAVKLRRGERAYGIVDDAVIDVTAIVA